MSEFLERERTERQNGISNTREPSRQLGVGIAALSEPVLQSGKPQAGAAHYLLASCGTTGCVPQRIHRQAQPNANTLNGRHDRRFG